MPKITHSYHILIAFYLLFILSELRDILTSICRSSHIPAPTHGPPQAPLMVGPARNARFCQTIHAMSSPLVIAQGGPMVEWAPGQR